jgi:S1-C subfamily serine protease
MISASTQDQLELAKSGERQPMCALFVTASHCVSESDETHERVDVMKTQFFITFYEKSADKKFYKAKLLMAVYQPKGDDFSILSVDTTDTIPVVSLGDEKLDETGLPIINVASPNGLGKQVFHGSISSLYVDRPFIQEDINWQGVMLLQVQLGPGSSGSAIVSTKQEAIIGFLVGHQGGNSFAMPVSRFKVFRQAVLDGKYKYFNKDSYNEVIPATKGAAAVPKP